MDGIINKGAIKKFIKQVLKLFIFSRLTVLMGVFLFLGVKSSFGQIEPSFTQFFVNPYHFNPSYAGIEGRPTLFMYYRQQWMGIDGAPQTANLSFHTPLFLGLTFGLDVMNDSRGIIKTNVGMLSLGYVVPFSRTVFLRFGISGGAGFRNFDLNDPTINTSDPALKNITDNNIYAEGNVGISFQAGYFNLGVSIPSIFQPDINSLKAFETSYISPTDKLLINASYRFYFAGDNLAFEPEVLYRYYKNEPTQYEGAAILHIKNLIWLGGSFRQDYGISAFGGIKIFNLLSVGYSYGVGSQSLPGIGSATHEILLTLFTGKQTNAKKKDKKLYLSFIDATKYVPPKPEKKPVVVARNEEPEKKPLEEEVKPVEKDTAQAVTEVKPVARDTTTARRETAGPRLQVTEKRILPGEDTATTAVKEPAVTTQQPVREEYVKKGTSESELQAGSYIIIGSYNFKENAERMAQTTLGLGYPASVGYLSERGHWYVYVKKGEYPDQIRPYLPRIRQEMDVKDAWILNVYETESDLQRIRENDGNIQNLNVTEPESGEENNKAMESLGTELGVRHEIVSRGNNQFELLSGNYIIVGVFSTFVACERYSDQLHAIGQSVKWGYNSQKNYWYVYIYYSKTVDSIREHLAQIRKVPQFNDAWLLTVQ